MTNDKDFPARWKLVEESSDAARDILIAFPIRKAPRHIDLRRDSINADGLW